MVVTYWDSLQYRQVIRIKDRTPNTNIFNVVDMYTVFTG